MSPFSPRGDRSLRIIVAELVAQATPGTLLTYKTLGEALGIDPDNRRDQIRQAISAARPLMLSDYKRTVVALRGQGYRVALANEFAGIAQGHRQKADRQMTKALAVVTNVNESELSPDELQRHRAVAVIIKNLHSRLNGAEDRLQRLEEAVFGGKPVVIPGHVEQ